MAMPFTLKYMNEHFFVGKVAKGSIQLCSVVPVPLQPYMAMPCTLKYMNEHFFVGKVAKGSIQLCSVVPEILEKDI